MLSDIELPEGLELARTTPAFGPDNVPKGLLSSHQVAESVWGRLCVTQGSVTFVKETSGESRQLSAGEFQVIEPGVSHHVELGEDAQFAVEFYH